MPPFDFRSRKTAPDARSEPTPTPTQRFSGAVSGRERFHGGGFLAICDVSKKTCFLLLLGAAALAAWFFVLLNTAFAVEGLTAESSNGLKWPILIPGEGHSIIGNNEREKLQIPKSSEENKENKEVRLQQFNDQLAIAKLYLQVQPTKIHYHFVTELRKRIVDVQSTINNANADSELPKDASATLKAMDETLSKGKKIINDCSKKSLRELVRSIGTELKLEKRQTFYLNQVLAKTVPKGLHCLSLKLSVDYNSLSSLQKNQFPNQEKLEDPNLYHYAIFSDNVLAAAVVVNSTVSHTKHPGEHVFHIITDDLNHAAMKMWFLSNPPRQATIQIQKVEDFTWLNSSYSPILKQKESESTIAYYFNTHGAKPDGYLKFRNPKYISILNHLRFYLPKIFPKLNKVVLLDDDVVVQKELIALWKIDLNGKVNGAVETCSGESFHRLYEYLNFSNPIIAEKFDPHACGWAFGMNVFDLAEWRRQNITEVYHSWQNLNQDRQLWKLGSLPAGLITFYNSTFPISRAWHVLGLGYNEDLIQRDIDRAAVLHYNGNKKPWLEIAIEKYLKYWSEYVDYNQIYLQRCNVAP